MRNLEKPLIPIYTDVNISYQDCKNIPPLLPIHHTTWFSTVNSTYICYGLFECMHTGLYA